VVSSIRSLPNKIDVALRRLDSRLPYPRFILDNVLDESEYSTLLNTFPDHLVGDPGDDGFTNYTIRPSADVTESISDEWKTFVQVLRSVTVKQGLVKACFSSAYKRYPLLWRWILRQRLQNVNNYEINIAFSANYAGRYLPPHTDNSYKVLALVLYFAPPGYSNLEEGTRFFTPHSRAVVKQAIRRFNRLADSRITRYTPLALQPMTSCSIHSGALATEEEQSNEQWFREHFDNDFNIDFQSNRVAGFIKTQNSFHAVDMRNSAYTGPRRSVLINLNLKHSAAARAWQSFRTRVLKLSS